MNYQYKALAVVAWQYLKNHGQTVPAELQNSILWTVGDGPHLKNPANTQVCSPIKEGTWVVLDVTKTPQITTYSDFKFNQIFELPKAPKKDGKYKPKK